MVQEVCQKRDILKHRIFFYSTILKKKNSRETVKSCFDGTFDHFLGKGGVLFPTFLPQIRC